MGTPDIGLNPRRVVQAKLLQTHRPPRGDTIRARRNHNQEGVPKSGLHINRDRHPVTPQCYLMVAHLYHLGHRHIAFVSGAGETETTRLRRQGFMDAAEALRICPSSVYASHGSLTGATSVVDDILKHTPRTTAIVTASDYVAVGILHGLFEKSYKVPRDISVIGFDNVQISQFLCPALTTMDADIPQLASVVCERLYSLMIDPITSIEPVLLAPQLVRRQSTGVPRPMDLEL